MKRAPNRLLTDTLREVRGTLSRFLSLVILSTLAVAFLAGLRVTAPDMKYTADRYYDAQHLMDLHVLSTLGLTEEDVAVLGEQPGIFMAQGGYTVDALLRQENGDLIVKALSLSEEINTPRLRQGRMPHGAGECLADPALLEASALTVGDSVTLDTGDGDMANALHGKMFTIVGVAESPLYISIERGSSSLGSGKVSAYLLLPQEAFNLEFYTDAYLLADGTADLQCYSDSYKNRMDALADQLEPLGDQRADNRYGKVVGEASETLADAQQEFDLAESGVNRALADAEQELKYARLELDNGWRELADGRATLRRETADATRKITDAERERSDAKAQLDRGELDYTEGMQALEDGWTDYRAGEQKLQDGATKYNDGLKTLTQGENEYNSSLVTLQDAEEEYRRGSAAYEAGIQKIKAGDGPLLKAKEELDRTKVQLEQGDTVLRESRRELDAANTELTQGQQQLDAGQTQLTQGQQQLDQAVQAVLQIMPSVPKDPAQWDSTVQVTITQTIIGAISNLEALEATQGGLPPKQKAQLEGLKQLNEETGGHAGRYLNQQKNTLNQSATYLQQKQSELNRGWSAYQTGLDEIRAASATLSAGWSQYTKGWNQYLNASSAYYKGVEEAQKAADDLTQARLELDAGWLQLQAGRKELDDGWSDLGRAKLELDDGQIELDAALAELLDGQIKLEDARLELDNGWQKYNEGTAELADAKARLPREIADAERDLANGQTELEDGEAEYTDGLQTYEEGRQEAEEELSDARKKLNDARREISEIEDCQWYIFGRNTNMGYVSFQQDAERMGNLASVFPLIFFLVAALVCLTTMTRMVEEQRVQIGSMKAMGYGKGAISLKYIGYGFAASLFGGLIGLALGGTLIPMIIFTAWKTLYTVGELTLYPSPVIGILAVLAAVVCVTGAAVAASMATLTAVPAQLMRPKAPPVGKRVLLERIGFLWRRLSFTQKVTVRNLFRYKKRFWMTVAGIGGCTALIVTGFGIRDSIFDITGLQYDGISTYSANIGLAEDVTGDELLELSHTLDRSTIVTGWMACHQTSLTVESSRRSIDAHLFAVDNPEKLADFIHLRHRLDHRPVTLPQEGAVITEKLADMLGVQPGDTVTLDGDRRVEVQITDTTENYVFHYIYLSAGYYEALYGTPPATNLILADYEPDTKENAEAVASALIPLSGVTAVSRIRDSRDTLSKSMESVDYAVIVVIISAAALAFVVLYNLTNINITERQRELATLKVLGFYDRELSAYVYRENVLLTIFGVLLGMVLGKYLHQWLVLTVEIDMVMFGRAAHPLSYLYAVVLTLLFSALVNLAAHRKLKKIDMVESLKTVE